MAGRLEAPLNKPVEISLGATYHDVAIVQDDIEVRAIVRRIWDKDHTVWDPDSTEIVDRLGWINAPEAMYGSLKQIEGFSNEIRESGYLQVVLLGMGGSTLGAQVLCQTFGVASGHPEVKVLDSTLPTSIRSVTETIDLETTLFLVASKSGTTIETISLYRYFMELVVEAVGKAAAGKNFVAITDPDTWLAQEAKEANFRKIFLNPPDVGGRFSVLSYFGLIPAALAGVNVREVLQRAKEMVADCSPNIPDRSNPGACLGGVIGALSLIGREKLVVVTSHSIDGFGPWVEQLLAESTGKQGKGIVPLIGEPLMNSSHYGDDRIFVYVRLDDDENAHLDDLVWNIKRAGHPLLQLNLRDKYDLGGEFFRWEMATAIIGAVLGIHPFDQQSVQQAKDETNRVLKEYQDFGYLPNVDVDDSFHGLLSEAHAGDYLAIMAYMQQTPLVDQAWLEFRRDVFGKYHIATTLGYGPRFLHSTGQLHKGGSNIGLFLQIVVNRDFDLAIPGSTYSFGVLADAQALGDLRVLKSLGRRVARIRLNPDHNGDFSSLG